MPPLTSREKGVGREELLRGSEARTSPSNFTRSSIEYSSSWNQQRKCCLVLHVYIKHQPVGDDHGAIANSDSVGLSQLVFDRKKYCQILSLAMKHGLRSVRQAPTVLLTQWFYTCFQVLQGTSLSPQGFAYHEDSLVDSVGPFPSPSPFSENDGIIMLYGHKFSIYRCYMYYGYVWIKEKATKTQHTVISIDAEQALDKIQHPFFIKTQQCGIEGNILQYNKDHI